MRILVISSTVWNTDNSFGNTFSNLFEGIDDISIANIYCNYGDPKNNIKGRYFQINEKLLIKNILNSKNNDPGKLVTTDVVNNLSNIEIKRLSSVKKRRWTVFFWIRKLIWFIGRWNSKELNNFIDDFKPDLIFVPLYHPSYLNRIILYVQKKTGVKLVTYALDDVYSLKRRSWSLFYWIERISNVRLSRKVIRRSDLMYSISEMQQDELKQQFNKKSKILRKGIEFNDLNVTYPSNKKKNKILKLVFTGNIYQGRWKSLSMISRALEEINKNSLNAQLYIYTASEVTSPMKKALFSEGNTFLMGSVPSEDIAKIQLDADILIHVESTDLKDRLEVRHSLSTKIVDYLSRSRCILAVGKRDVASIDYLKRNDIALIAEDTNQIIEILSGIIDKKIVLDDYSKRGIDFARKNHNINNIQNELYDDLNGLYNTNVQAKRQ